MNTGLQNLQHPDPRQDFSSWIDDLFNQHSQKSDQESEVELPKIESNSDIRDIISKLIEARKSKQANLEITPGLIQNTREYIAKDHYSNIITLIQNLGDPDIAFAPEFAMFAKIVQNQMPSSWYIDIVQASNSNATSYGYYGEYRVEKFKQRIAYLVTNSKENITADLIRYAFRKDPTESTRLIKEIFSYIGSEATIQQYPINYFYGILKELKNETDLFSEFVWENKNNKGGLLDNKTPQSLRNTQGLGYQGYENYPNLEQFIKFVSLRNNRLALDLIFSLWRLDPNKFVDLPSYLKNIDDSYLSQYLGNDISLFNKVIHSYFKKKHNDSQRIENFKEICRIIDFSNISPEDVYRLYDSFIGLFPNDIPNVTRGFSYSEKFREGKNLAKLHSDAVKQEIKENQLAVSYIAIGTEIRLEDNIDKLNSLKVLLAAPNINEAEIIGTIFVKFAPFLRELNVTNMANFLSDPAVLDHLGKFLIGTGLDGKTILDDLEIAILLKVLMTHHGLMKVNDQITTLESETFYGEISLRPTSVPDLLFLLYSKDGTPCFSDERRVNILSAQYLAKPVFNIIKLLDKIYNLSNINGIDFTDFLPQLFLAAVFKYDEYGFIFKEPKLRKVLTSDLVRMIIKSHELKSQKTESKNLQTLIMLNDLEGQRILDTKQISMFLEELEVSDSASIIAMIANVLINSESENQKIAILDSQTLKITLEEFLDILRNINPQKLKAIYKDTYKISKYSSPELSVDSVLKHKIFKLSQTQNKNESELKALLGIDH